MEYNNIMLVMGLETRCSLYKHGILYMIFITQKKHYFGVFILNKKKNFTGYTHFGGYERV